METYRKRAVVRIHAYCACATMVRVDHAARHADDHGNATAWQRGAQRLLIVCYRKRASGVRYTVFGTGWCVQSGVAARCVHRQTGVGVSTRVCPIWNTADIPSAVCETVL